MSTINPAKLEKSRKLSRYAIREHGGNILFLLPAFLLFAYVVLIPFIQSVPISFTDKKAIFAKEANFVGFKNYITLLKSSLFQDTFLHTAQFTLVYIVGANVLGLAVALMLWRSGKFNNVMRTLLFMPFTVSLVASTKVWSYVYTDILMPLTGQPSPLGISSQVIYGLAVIAIWRDMGYCMLIYIAALQSVPLEYYEAARVEGANPFHEFRYITAPMIVPAFTANITLLLSWGLRCFDYSQMVITMKTAKTTAVFVWEYIFGNSRAGLGQAAAIDGCGKFRTFWQIVFPLMTPVNVTQAVLNTLFVWNDYSVAVVLLRTDESRTLPLAQIMYFGENVTELNLAFAFFMLAMIPILVLYLCTQRFIVSGIMSGAVKG